MRNNLVKPKHAMGVSKQQGFSLIEVLTAFVLIGIGALGLIKLQTYVEQRADYAAHSIQALHLAEKKLEWFRTRGASAAASSIAVADFNTSIVDGNDTTHPLYSLSWSVPSITLSGAVKTVVIDAYWQDRFGQTQKVRLQTMLSKYSEFDN